MIKTDEYMTSPVITIGINENITALTKTMDHYNIGCVIVMDGTKAVGIVTERDIIRKVLSKDKDMKKTTAKDVMSKNLQVVQRNATLMEVASLMKAHTLRRIVVMDHGSPVGMITSRDLIDLLV